MRWLYKAAQSKLDYPGTLLLADRGFLCRSAHEAKDLTRADNVRKVKLGDELHVYYSGRGKVRDIGAFDVIEPKDHPTPSVFGEIVPDTALHVVEKPEFLTAIDTAGEYAPDPIVHKYTGWILRRRGRPLPYAASFFPGQMTLVPYVASATFFRNNDTQFEAWCASHPEAFFANLHGSEDESGDGYFLVHRATCKTGAGRASPETPQPRTGYNPKLVADRIEELTAWARSKRPNALVKRCKSCEPLDDIQADLEPTPDPLVYDQRVQRLMGNELPERPSGNPKPAQQMADAVSRYVRDPRVGWWVLRRAAGRCELCLNAAPFQRLSGEPFLEVHHITRLADEGPDTPANAAGVCPNCHRQLHHGGDAVACTERLREIVLAKEQAL